MAQETDTVPSLVQQAQAAAGPPSLVEQAQAVPPEPLTTQAQDAVPSLVDQAEGSDAITEPVRVAQPQGSIWSAAQDFVEKLFEQPTGQLGAAGKLALAQPGAPSSPYDPTPLVNAVARTARLAFPKAFLDEQPPTADEFENLAKQDPEFGKVWEGLKAQRDASQQKAKELHGDHPDWDAINQDFIAKVQDNAAQARKTARQPGQLELPMPPDPRDTEGIMRLAATLSEPGVDIEPLSDKDIASGAFKLLSAKGAEDIQALPSWIRAGITGVTTGAKMAAAAATGLPPAMQGVVFEGARQGMQVASGARQTMDAGDVALSGLLMGAAGKAGKYAEEAFPGASKAAQAAAGATAQVGTFEAAAAAQKVLAQVQEKGAPKEQEPQAPLWSRLFDHVVELATTMGTAGALAGMGKPSEPEAKAPDLGTATDLKAAQDTMKALKATLRRATFQGEGPPERVAQRDRTINEDFLPAETAIDKAVAEYDAAAKKEAGKDPELRKKIDQITLMSVETNGNFPVPQDLVPPENLARLIALRREVGAAGLELGKVLNKYGVLPDARYQYPGSTGSIVLSKTERMKSGGVEPDVTGAELVGGLKYHEQRGFFFPQVTEQAEAPPVEQPPIPTKNLGPKPPAVNNAEALGHMKARRQTTEEAFASRPLDTSLDAGYRVLLSEAQFGRGMAHYDLARADGDLLMKNELPDAAARAQMEYRAKQLDATIAAKRKELKLFSPEDQSRGLREIAGLLKERGDLQAASKENFYKELRGKRYGPYEGMFMHPDALSRAQQALPDPSAMGYVFKSLQSAFKWVKEGFNTALWGDHWSRNHRQYVNSGINELPELEHATDISLKRGVRDSIDHELIAQARRASWGGVAEITKGDVAAPRRLQQKIAEAQANGQSTKALNFAKAVYERGKLMDKLPAVVRKPLELFAQIPKLQMALTDNAQALAAYRVLRTKGVGGSGPMGPTDAFDYLRGVSDLSTVGPAATAASNVLTFIRRPIKSLQAMVNRQMLLRPTVMGQPIPTALDAVIQSAPESPGAQAALVARGMLRLGTTAASWLGPLKGIQMASAAASGISQKELEKDLKDKFAYLPGPIAWLSRQAFVPTGRTQTGDIDGIDLGKYIPELRAMRYFAWPDSITQLFKNPARAINDTLYAISQKNIFAGPIAQAATKQNFMGVPVGEGFGPGKQMWPIESQVLPGSPFRTIEEYFMQQQAPPEERSAMRNALRTVFGVPLTTLGKQDFADRELHRLYNEGTVGLDVKDDGSSSYFVKQPQTKEGMYATMLMEMHKEMPGSLDRVIRREYRRRQSLLEGMGLK